MKAINLIIILVLLASASCNNAGSEQQSNDKQEDTAKKMSPTPIAVKDSSSHITARFTSYSLGDASHFVFTDEAGKEWDFADNTDTTYTFASELPKNKSNETNQGWGSNAALQGKWFDITYVIKKQPQYQDGPMANVPVIVSVKMKEK